MSETSRTDRWARAVLAGPFEVVIDVAAWAAAATVAVYLRFDFEPSHANLVALAKFIPLTALAQCAFGLSIGLYRRRWRYGSFEEVQALALTVALSTAVLYLIDRFYFGVPRYMPLSAVLFGGFVGLVLMAGARYVFRLLQERRRRPDVGARQASARLRCGARRQTGDLVDDGDTGQPVPAGRTRRRQPEQAPALDPRRRCARDREPTSPASSTRPAPRRSSSPRPQQARSWSRSSRRRPSVSVSTSRCCRRCKSCSAPPPASATSATSPRPTCSAGTRSTPTSTPSPATSAASACSSPEPAGRSAPSCAGSCTCSARPS